MKQKLKWKKEIKEKTAQKITFWSHLNKLGLIEEISLYTDAYKKQRPSINLQLQLKAARCIDLNKKY